MIKFEEIENAFDFVSSAEQCVNEAVISKSTGKSYFLSGYDDSDELPEDVDNSDDYVGKGKLKYTPNSKQKYIGNGKQKCSIKGKTEIHY